MLSDFLEELKQSTKEKIKYWYNKLKYPLLALLFIFSVLSIKFFNIIEPREIESQAIYFLGISISNWLEWITIVTIPFTACWAVYQYNKNLASKKQEKAVEIAKEFSETLVSSLDIINNVYQKSSLLPFMPIEEEKAKLFKYFNAEEVRRIFNNDNYVSEYKKERLSKMQELDNIYHIILCKSISSYSKTNFWDDLIAKSKLNSLTDNDILEIENEFKKINNIPYHFIELESQVLNKLEYICMNISSKAADSNYIYQSLHQLFLRTMRTLYLDISLINTNSTNKFYTNIIHVYLRWRDKYLKDLKLEEHKIKKWNEHLNPKIKTV